MLVPKDNPELTPEERQPLKDLQLPDPYETSQALKDFCNALSRGYIKGDIFKDFYDEILDNYECANIIKGAKRSLQKKLLSLIQGKSKRKALKKIIKAKSIIIDYKKHNDPKIPMMYKKFVSFKDSIALRSQKKSFLFTENRIKKICLLYSYIESQCNMRRVYSKPKDKQKVNIFTKDLCNFFHRNNATIVGWLRGCEALGMIKLDHFKNKRRWCWKIEILLQPSEINLYVKQFGSMLEKSDGHIDQCLVECAQHFADNGTKLFHPDDENLKVYYINRRQIAEDLNMTPQYFDVMLKKLVDEGTVTKHILSERKAAYSIPESTLNVLDAYLIINHDEVDEFRDIRTNYEYKFLLQHRYNGINLAIDEILARKAAKQNSS